MPTTSWNRGYMASLILGACRGVLIYLAGPLFSEAERRFNQVFLPQRDGVEAGTE
jgi:hypothetical protein